MKIKRKNPDSYLTVNGERVSLANIPVLDIEFDAGVTAGDELLKQREELISEAIINRDSAVKAAHEYYDGYTDGINAVFAELINEMEGET